MALIDKASLLMVPSTYEAGKLYNVLPSGNRAPDSTGENSGYDQTRADFTFDRGTNAAATRVNSDGLIEKYRENTAEHSNTFNDWSNKTNASLTSGQIDKDGGTDAWKMQATAASYCYIFDTPTTNTGIRTRSVYAKQGTSSNLTLLWNSFNNNVYASFDLSNGTFTNANCLADIEDVGGGWYRCVSTITDASNTYACLISISDETGSFATIGDNIYIQNFQQEAGLVATDYLESTSVTGKAGVLIDLPRINYDANGENGSLLLEPQRTNLVTYSEYFEHSLWDSGATTAEVSKSPNLSPEGVANCYYVENVSGGQLGFYTTITSGASYTGSFWVRKVSGSGVVRMLNVNNSGTDFNVGTEWTRVSVTATSTSTTGRCYVRAQNTGDIIEVYGAQLEAGSYATSYIPNHGTSGGVTRAADSCSVTGVSDVIGQTEGTMFLDWNYLSNDGSYDFRFNLSDGAAVTEWLFIGMTNGDARAYVTSGGSAQFDSEDEYAITIGNRYKMALAYANNDFAFYINGTQVATSSSGSVPTGIDYITMSNVPNSKNSVVKESVNQTALFNERLTNEELATLTTL